MRETILDAVIDIETLGTGADARIIGIGAVAVVNGKVPNYSAGTLRDVTRPELYHRVVSSDGLANAQRSSTTSTLEFWSEQDPALMEFYGVAVSLQGKYPGMPLKNALVELAYWCAQLRELYRGVVRPWGNGSIFDIGILEHAYTQCGLPVPWEFRNIRDVRTRKEDALHIAKLAGIDVDIPFEGIKHYALDDAYHEATIIVKAQQLITDGAKALKDLNEFNNIAEKPNG